MKGKPINKKFLNLWLLSAVLFVALVGSCQNSAELKNMVDQERRTRMELEEQALSLSWRNSELEQRVDKLQAMLNKQRVAGEVSNQALSQEIEKLRQRLQAVSELSSELEKSLTGD